jgi:hypothetical protein
MARRAKVKRFTVSLDSADYTEFRRIAKSHKPPLSLQYVVRFALERFLERNRGKQLSLDLHSPES